MENTALSVSAEQQVVEICDKPITNPHIPTEIISEADQTQDSNQDRSAKWESLSVLWDGQAGRYLFLLLNDLYQYRYL